MFQPLSKCRFGGDGVWSRITEQRRSEARHEKLSADKLRNMGVNKSERKAGAGGNQRPRECGLTLNKVVWACLLLMRGRGGNVREREHEWDKIPENVREETVFRAQGKVQHSTGWRAFLWCLWERMNQWVFNADICKFNIKLMQDFWKALILCVK